MQKQKSNTNTHTHTHTYKLLHTITDTHTPSRTYRHTHTHTFSLSHTHTHTHMQTHTFIHTLTSHVNRLCKDILFLCPCPVVSLWEWSIMWCISKDSWSQQYVNALVKNLLKITSYQSSDLQRLDKILLIVPARQSPICDGPFASKENTYLAYTP